MKTIDDWLLLYGRDHQNPTNKLIHWFCVPVIMFTVLGLLWCIPLRVPGYEWINVATVFYTFALIFYFRLSIPLFFGFLIIGGLMLYLNAVFYTSLGDGDTNTYLYILIGVFIFAWILQFIGHKIEGQK